MPQSFICPLAIICINSMPLNKMRAQRNVLNPNVGRVLRLIARWSCSTMLLRYLTSGSRWASHARRSRHATRPDWHRSCR